MHKNQCRVMRVKGPVMLGLISIAEAEWSLLLIPH